MIDSGEQLESSKSVVRVRASPLFLWPALALVAFSGNLSWALDPSLRPSDYPHRVWQADDGLYGPISALLQTRDGYLWLGTAYGLARFDGLHIAAVHDVNALMNQKEILALHEARDGSLWVGTHGAGVARVRDGHVTSLTSKDGLPDNSVFSLAEDAAGGIWIGTRAGLCVFRDDRLNVYGAREGFPFPNEPVRTVFIDGDGKVWIGGRGWLVEFTRGQFRTYDLSASLPAHAFVRTLSSLPDHTLWLGSDAGLGATAASGRPTTGQRIAGVSVSALRRDRDGALWIGTAGSGLYRLSGDVLARYTAKDGLSSDYVYSLMEDREGSLWIGTRRGLDVLQQASLKTYTTREGLADDSAHAVHQDRSGSLWVATDSALNRLKDGRSATFTTWSGRLDNPARVLYGDRDGSLLVGTRFGINRLQGHLWTSLMRTTAPEANVRALCRDRRGDLWIGRAGLGLTRISGATSFTYTVKDGLIDDDVTSLHEDRNGALWIGTDAGLSKLHDQSFTSFTSRDGLPGDDVRAFYEDADGVLWIAMRGGLARYKDGRLGSFTTAQGLFDDSIFEVLEDDAGNLWMGSPRGIFRIAKKDLNDVASGRVDRVTSVSYGTADGMRSAQCTGDGFQPAGWKTRDGRLWFATVAGVAVIDPKQSYFNSQPPAVVVEAVVADGRVLDLASARSLAPGTKNVEFNYAGLSFVAPDKVRFKYRLDGLDDTWIDAGYRRVAHYAHLRPGRYGFQVRAANRYGVWNEKGAKFDFEVKPLFYQTSGFIAASCLALILAAWSVHRLRMRHVEARWAAILSERSRIARDLHDGLQQSLAAASLEVEDVGEDLPSELTAPKRRLHHAREILSRTIVEARRSVWDLRPQALSGGDLAGALSDWVEESKTPRGPEVVLRILGNARELTPVVEKHLFRIAQEAVTNVTRHAGAQRAVVELEFGAETVRLSVRDDGRGFESEGARPDEEEHLGLRGMKERASQIEGHFSVHSRPGEGAEIVVEVPTRA